MIGRRGWLAIGLVLGVGVAFGLRTADPLAADPALRGRIEQQAVEQAVAADRALAALDRGLARAGDDMRQGSAAVGAGTDQPGPFFLSAATHVDEGTAARMEAELQLDGLVRSLARLGTTEFTLLAWSAADHQVLVDQLENTAPAADVFLSIRLASEEAMHQLGVAAAAITRSDLDAARAALDAADAEVATVALARDRLDTLPIWLDTTGELIAAARDIVAAAESNDPDALAEAVARYGEAAGAASLADRALAVALAEGAGGVTSRAQASLALARRAVADARAGLVALSILP
jgi:hypothetical protein